MKGVGCGKAKKGIHRVFRGWSLEKGAPIGHKDKSAEVGSVEWEEVPVRVWAQGYMEISFLRL